VCVSLFYVNDIGSTGSRGRTRGIPCVYPSPYVTRTRTLTRRRTVVTDTVQPELDSEVRTRTVTWRRCPGSGPGPRVPGPASPPDAPRPHTQTVTGPATPKFIQVTCQCQCIIQLAHHTRSARSRARPNSLPVLAVFLHVRAAASDYLRGITLWRTRPSSLEASAAPARAGEFCLRSRSRKTLSSSE